MALARPTGLTAGRRVVVNRARLRGVGPSGFHPWRGPDLTVRRKDATLRTATHFDGLSRCGGRPDIPL